MGAAAKTANLGKRLGRPGQFRWPLLLFPLLTIGCVHTRDTIEKNLMADRSTRESRKGIATSYQVGCPDVLEVVISGPDGFSDRKPVAADGRIDLGAAGRPRVEGRTPSEVVRTVAQHLGRPASEVQVQVAEHKSQQVFLFGQVVGWHRAVPYQGQETVLELLQRAGGITPGAQVEDVYVVRSNVADGKRPEIFHIDLQAIVLNQDERTNLRLHPYDQIYIGGTRQASVEKCLPRWFRPLYHAAWGTRPADPDDQGPLKERRHPSSQEVRNMPGSTKSNQLN